MKKAPPILTFVIGLLLGASAGVVITYASLAPPAPPSSRESDGVPSREQVLACLDGKTADISASDRGPAKTPTLHRDQIAALDVDQFAVRAGGDPWGVEVKLVVDTGEGRYALTLEVRHERIGNERVFHGFKVTKAVRE